MTTLSSAQQKIVDRIKAGAALSFDTGPGRYVIREAGRTSYADQRTIDAMLKNQFIAQDIMGRCEIVDDARR